MARLSTVLPLDKQPRLSWMACELLVATKFADQHFGVSFPLWPQAYDLVVDKAGRLLRVQVRLAQFVLQRMRKLGKGDRAHYRADLMKRSSRTRTRTRIDDSRFDYLAVVCDPERVYLIPVEQLQSPLQPGLLYRTIVIKLPLQGRRDSATAGLRWERFLNRFDLVD